MVTAHVPARADRESGSVVAVCLSDEKGTAKTPRPSAELAVRHGLLGDAHAGAWHRQVSLLAEERIGEMRASGADVGLGDFGENFVIRGIDLDVLSVGDLLAVGKDAVLEVTQRGKECHTRCAIYYSVGRCIMPTHGIFARVIEAGVVAEGDAVVLTRSAAEGLAPLLSVQFGDGGPASR